MGLGDLHLRLKAFRLRRFLVGDFRRRKGRGVWSKKKPSWMTPVSHGYYVVDRKPNQTPILDSVVVQREQIKELEIWYFGVFDPQTGGGVAKYLQSHLFDSNLKEAQIKRKSKEIMTKAYLSIGGMVKEVDDADETQGSGSASAMVIDGETLIISDIGGYRAVVCRDGSAHRAPGKQHRGAKRCWSQKLFQASILGCNSKANAEDASGSGASEVAVAKEWVGSDTEFVILASSGIWEVMKSQEAVNLIRHIEDPQAAAECLAKEAFSRMSKRNISCIVIRFD